MKINRNLFYFIVFLPLVLIVGFRGATPDTQVYYSLFKSIDSYNINSYYGYYLDTGVELGWGLYSKLVIQFSDSPYVLFSLFSFFIFFIIYKSSRILNLNYFHVLIFYIPTGFFFMQQFMQIRQALAVSAVIYAALLLLSNKFFQAFIFFVIAILFHQLALPIIILSIIYYFLSKKIDLSSSVSSFRFNNLFIVFFSFLFVEFFLKNYLIGSIDRLQAYSETEEYGKSVGFFSPANFKNYILFVIFITLTNDKLLSNKFYVFLVYLFTIGLSLRVSFYDFAILSGRLSNIFAYVEIFILPFIFNERLKINSKFFLMFIYFILIIFITWFFQASEYLSVSYFEKVN